MLYVLHKNGKWRVSSMLSKYIDTYKMMEEILLCCENTGRNVDQVNFTRSFTRGSISTNVVKVESLGNLFPRAL